MCFIMNKLHEETACLNSKQMKQTCDYFWYIPEICRSYPDEHGIRVQSPRQDPHTLCSVFLKFVVDDICRQLVMQQLHYCAYQEINNMGRKTSDHVS